MQWQYWEIDSFKSVYLGSGYIETISILFKIASLAFLDAPKGFIFELKSLISFLFRPNSFDKSNKLAPWLILISTS